MAHNFLCEPHKTKKCICSHTSQKQLIYWDFHAQPSLGFTENGPKKRKYPVSARCSLAVQHLHQKSEGSDWLLRMLIQEHEHAACIHHSELYE